METDSSLSWLALGLSILLFCAAATVEASLASVRVDGLRRLLARGAPGSRHLEALFAGRRGPASVLPVLRYVLLASGVVSAVAVVVSYGGANWVLIAVAPFVTLVAIGALRLAGLWLGTRAGVGLALKAAPVVRALAWPLTPVLAAVRLAEGTGSKSDGSGDGQETLSTGLRLDTDEQPLDEHEMRMIRGVVRLDRTTAREIMVPRVDITAFEAGTPIRDLVDGMVKSGHSRVPVYRESLDNISGIAHARDLLAVPSDDTGQGVTDATTRPALFIPESKTLEDLLSQFQEERVSVAIVVDEYGGVSGLVTIEDLLEEIVGEISDEFDVGTPEIERVSADVILMDARVSIEYLHDLLDVEIEGDGFDTVGGFVYQRLGKIPSTGDTVDYDGIRIEVVSTIGRRPKRLRVTKLGQSAGATDG